MAKKKSGTQIDSSFQSIEGSISKTEQFLEKYQKQLTIAALVILAGVALVFAYKQFYLGPLEEEVQEQMFVAQQYFERDSFDLALNGDGDYLGFLDIVDDYGSTGAGNLSNLYAGISFFKIGQYEDALDYLLDFSTKDKLLSPIANGCIGDSYVELGEYESSINYYKKAYEDSENSLTTPIFLMKYARVNEELGDWEKALEAYNKIKKDFSDTDEGRTIQKYITRAELNI